MVDPSNYVQDEVEQELSDRMELSRNGNGNESSGSTAASSSGATTSEANGEATSGEIENRNNNDENLAAVEKTSEGKVLQPLTGSKINTDDVMFEEEANFDDQEPGKLSRNGSTCSRILRCLRLEQCFEKPVNVPKKGAPVKTIKLEVPLTDKFLAQQKKEAKVYRKTNSIRTAKYSIWTFLPFSIAFQFKRFVNFYYLLIVILLIIGNTWPNLFLAPWEASGTATYLAILVVAGIAVEVQTDLARHRGDREENRRVISRIDTNGKIVETKWGKLLPGDLVIVNDRESFPADVIMLYSTSNENRSQCYIETSSIDGETNLKIKEVPTALNKRILAKRNNEVMKNSLAEQSDVAKVIARITRGTFDIEQPNAFLQFSGAFTPSSSQSMKSSVEKQSFAAEQGEYGNDYHDKVPLEFRNLVLRGSQLRNTKWMIGLVIYAGHETKLSLSRSASPAKFSRLDTLINRLMLSLLIIFFVIVILADGMLFLEPDTALFWYFQNTSSTDAYLLPGWFAFFLTFVILFSALIPISMVLLQEILNEYMQFLINNDARMYHEETDTPARCRSAALSAEIGQISHFFSDKTGTLTRNEMKLVALYTPSNKYGFEPPPIPENDGDSDKGDSNNNDDGKKSNDINSENVVKNDPLTNPAPNALGSSRISRHESTCSDAVGELEQPKDIPQKEIFKDAIELLSTEEMTQEKQELLDLIVFLAVCHTVILDVDEESGNASLNAESPDEEAFVKGVEQLGVKLLQANEGLVKVQDPTGQVLAYNILALNPFNSTRKRMSLIICREWDQSIALFMKGADNVMLERCAPGQDDLVDRLKVKLLQYAWGGLRTLVMGKRELEEQEFLAWQDQYNEASVAPSAEREEALASAAETIEENVTLLGATAIEDQLQLGVPEAIQTLRDAGIQVWVLTGDKVETAINIGLSSKLLDSKMLQLKLLSKNQEELLDQLTRIHDLLQKAIDEKTESDEQDGSPTSPVNDPEAVGAVAAGSTSPSSARRKSKAQRTNLKSGIGAGYFTAGCLAMIVSGGALESILTEQKGNAEIQQLFLDVARSCKVVLACRVSPKQKSLIVELVRYAPDNKQLRREPITLAIGDGANDVPMIQAAHVGVGISGHEGRQAVNSSDFSIAQFRFVVTLLLVHGRTNYRRHAVVITYLIYSWIVYVFVLYIYNPYTLWSGQQVYYEYLYTFFAAFVLNFAIISHGWFQTDLSAKFVLQNPWVYAVGAQNQDLNSRNLAYVVLKAGIHLLFIWIFVFLGSPDVVSQAAFGSTTYVCVFLLLYFEQLMLGNSFTAVTAFCFLILIVGFFIMMSLVTTPIYIWDPIALAGLSWVQIFGVVATAVALSVLVSHIISEFFPSPLKLLMEQDRGYYYGQRGDRKSRRDALKVMKETARLFVLPVDLGVAKFRQIRADRNENQKQQQQEHQTEHDQDGKDLEKKDRPDLHVAVPPPPPTSSSSAAAAASGAIERSVASAPLLEPVTPSPIPTIDFGVAVDTPETYGPLTSIGSEEFSVIREDAEHHEDSSIPRRPHSIDHPHLPSSRASSSLFSSSTRLKLRPYVTTSRSPLPKSPPKKE